MTTKTTITLLPTYAALNFTHSLSSTPARSLNISCSLEIGQDVRLPSEGSLKNASWNVFVAEADDFNPHASEQGAIGYLKYHPESHGIEHNFPETCNASFALKAEIFGTLLSAIQSGHLPASISVVTKGLEWGWEPDGSGVVWDTKACPNVPIVEVGFNVPFSAESESSFASANPMENTEATSLRPSTMHDVKSLEMTLASGLKMIEKGFIRIGVVLIVIAALVYFRH